MLVAMQEPVCGLFVGGQARRMGRVAKGLLPAPDTGEPLVIRLRQKAESLGLRCVLVGEAPAYAGLGLPMLADDPPGIGPLGGLRALLGAAAGAPVLALACDLPFVSRELLGLLAAFCPPEIDRADGTLPLRAPFAAAAHRQEHERAPADGPIDVLAARRQERWEPLCARYHASVLPVLEAALAQGERSFQGLLRRLRVGELRLSLEQERELTDWDTPGDITGPPLPMAKKSG